MPNHVRDELEARQAARAAAALPSARAAREATACETALRCEVERQAAVIERAAEIELVATMASCLKEGCYAADNFMNAELAVTFAYAILDEARRQAEARA